MNSRYIILCFLTLTVGLCISCKKDTPVDAGIIQLSTCTIGSVPLKYPDKTSDIANDADIELKFSSAVDTNSAKNNILLTRMDNTTVPGKYTFTDNNSVITFNPVDPLANVTDYKVSITSSLKGSKGESFAGIEYTFTTANGAFVIKTISINNKNFMPPAKGKNIKINDLNIMIQFSTAPDPANLKSYFTLTGNPAFDLTISGEGNNVLIHYPDALKGYSNYNFSVSSDLKTINGYTFNGFSNTFYTGLDSTIKFPQISDDELLTLIQQQTFKYFYDFADPASGMARERSNSGTTVTTGGSGFGVMALVVGMKRNFITRNEGVNRLTKIVGFLETADRFHGAWSHWINGSTGKAIPFSSNDNGGDLVETALLIQGLIAVRQYLDPNVTTEKNLIDRITTLYNGVEWDWYTRGGQNVLYWHWSPTVGWAMNFQLQGYNETLITYVMAASSTTHTIPKTAYTLGYARNGDIKNGKTFYGIVLPVGFDYGGPLFFAHYSFLGLDPRHLSDQYANYWDQNVNHTLINWKHCVTNPSKYPNYNAFCWGLTASDMPPPDNYGASEPTRDKGTIAPTAAISSLPYTTTQSMDAIRYFYYIVGDRLWGKYGFYDAFDAANNWWASSYLAIDQGTQIIMIENHRTGLLWDLFMSAPEVKAGLTKLGFSYSK